MEENWNISEIRHFGDLFKYKKYQAYQITESLWQSYVAGYPDFPDLTFRDYLLKEWPVFYEPESVLLEISIWSEVRKSITDKQKER